MWDQSLTEIVQDLLFLLIEKKKSYLLCHEYGNMTSF